MKHLILPFMAGIFLMCNTKNNNLKSDSPVAGNSITHNDTTPSKNNTLSGDWQLMPVLASDTAAGRKPLLSFDLGANRFTGNTGCNDMSGSFFLKGDSLVFKEQIVQTKIECAGYNERAFIDNLTKVNHYRIENGVLQLLTDKTILSKWVRKENVKNTATKI